MKRKMNIKLELAMNIVTVLYLLITILLSKLNLIDSDNFITIPSAIWVVMWAIIMLNGKRLSGITDELVLSILSKINKIGMNFLVISIVIFSIILISPLYEDLVISKVSIGICLLLILFIFTIIRLLSFIYYDRKGIYK
ncbi:hypothetical protein LGL55_22775 [Clostridium tagluense]|uniref:hypothetical protein n=1 Tax=Clostridium tagluense TaxID=360422 RepID=UPI001C0AE1C5|nr:hypothetical protein [Clostridium tagluense]MBU3130481.1 hypothetical protein [Clostridium tagluense]MCB2300821.1 hypothetical protein [Clostridium tagluense]MCB2311843.1 hypothetical protein [Clostridium tagluense]MCB2317401.1 hypothetical protein [Clostridium tagluense]MCB2323754.1 hypothetical protein [Clostridium tagluense]